MKYDNEPKPPEWWTTENTEAWTRERWADGSQGEWGEKIQRGEIQAGKSLKAGAACYRPIPPEVMAKWRENDLRPANRFFYDGRPMPEIRPFAKKKRASRKAVAA